MKKIKENLKKRKEKLQKAISGLEERLDEFDAKKSIWEFLKQKISTGMKEARNYSKNRINS